MVRVLLLLIAAVHSLQLPALKLPTFEGFTGSVASINLGGYGDAASACAAVAAAPNDGAAWRRLGRMLHGKGRLEASRSALARATELDPTNAPCFVDLANVERSIGRFDESTAALLSASEITGKPDQSLCYWRTPTSSEYSLPPPAACSLHSTPATGGDGSVWVTRLAEPAECDWVIETAERFNEARGGWGNPPPRYSPAGTNGDDVRAPHMLVADSPELLQWLNGKLEAVVWPTLAAQFGASAASDMWLYDAFLLKFDGQPGRRGLGIHVDDDGLGLSLNMLLADADSFEGGGTYFEEADFTVTPQQGELVSHHSGVRHASVPTTGGLRYILVAFLRSPSLAVEPPEDQGPLCYCEASQASVAGAVS